MRPNNQVDGLVCEHARAPGSTQAPPEARGVEGAGGLMVPFAPQPGLFPCTADRSDDARPLSMCPVPPEGSPVPPEFPSAPGRRGWLGLLMSPGLAIDLGTANTRVGSEGRGLLVDEPSIVALDVESRIRAAGAAAKEMLGRTPRSIQAVCPVRSGVIAEPEIAEAMLRYHLRRTFGRRGLLRSRAVVALPSETTALEKRAAQQVAESAGARKVFLVEQPMAGALGAGLPVMAPRGSMIVAVGGGTTDVAVLALGGRVVGRGVTASGQQIDEAISSYLKRKHNLLIGPRGAERLKLQIASAIPPEEDKTAIVRGRGVPSGIPHGVEVSTAELVEPIQEPLDAIVQAVREVFEVTPRGKAA